MSKKEPPPLFPGAGLTGSPSLTRPTQLGAAATAFGGVSGGSGTSGTIGTRGGAADLQGKTSTISAAQAVRTRGYQRRSFNQYSQQCKDLLGQIQEEELQNPHLTTLCQEAYQKLKSTFEKFDSANQLVISASDVTDVQVGEAEGLFEEYFKEFHNLESQILKQLGSLTPSKAMTRLGLPPTGPFEIPEPAMAELEEKPQFRFRGPPKIDPEGDQDKQALQFMMKAMTLNYKPADHITVFDGDQFQYTSYRTSWEIADRNMSEIGYSPFEKFLEIKKTLKGEPLKMVATLPNLDSSYEAALDLLDRFYLNPQNSIKRVTDSLNSLPRMTNSIESIKSFYQELVSITHAFKALNMIESDMGRTLIINSIMPKLSPACCREFFKITQRKRNYNSPMGHDATISDLMECVLFQLQLAQQMKEVTPSGDKAKVQTTPAQQKQGNSPFKSFKVAEAKEEAKKKSCHICKKNNHETKDCFLLKTLNPKDLFDKIKAQKLCRLCFYSHHTNTCKFAQQNLCKECKGRHNSLIHLKKEEIKSNSGNSSAKQKSDNPSPSKTVKFTANRAMEAIPHILRAHLTSTNPRDPRSMIVNVLFDTGSSINLIRKEIAEKLKLETMKSLRSGDSQTAVGVGNTKLPIDLTQRVSFTLSPVVGPKYQSPKIEGFLTSEIDSELGGLDFDPKASKHLKNLELTLPMPHQPLQVDLLLGEPWVTFFTTSAPIKDPTLKEPHVVAIQTKLGVFLGGQSSQTTDRLAIRQISANQIPLDQTQTMPCNGSKKDQSGNPGSDLPQRDPIRETN